MKISELEHLSKARLEDAKALYQAGRYEGAVYICGYAVELGLKKKICITLGWSEYAEKYTSFKTHALEVLLHFSGVESYINQNLLSEWSVVMSWNSELRYSSKKQTQQEAKLMIDSTETILKNL